MTTAAELRDTDVVRAWVHGWARARGVPVHPVGAAWRVGIGAGSRATEYVLAQPDSEALAGLVPVVAGRADTWLTVCTPVAVSATHLAQETGLEVAVGDETLMGAELRPPEPDARVRTDADGPVARAVVLADGVVAADGTVALEDGWAVFDRVQTDPGHRRRGLGSAVMQALAGWALDRGVSAGALVASPEGALLYRRLGWTQRGAMISLRGRAG